MGIDLILSSIAREMNVTRPFQPNLFQSFMQIYVSTREGTGWKADVLNCVSMRLCITLAHINTEYSTYSYPRSI